MNVTFALFTHLSNDDRIWFHQAKSLVANQCNVAIVSAYANVRVDANARIIHDFVDGIDIFSFDHAKYQRSTAFTLMADLLAKTEPDTIICDSPLAVVAAAKYKMSRKNNKKVTLVYDVTEWYPSKKNLFQLNGFHKFIKSIILTLVNFYAGCVANRFIFGEYYKGQPFRRLFPRKPYIFLPYYPNLRYIHPIDDKPTMCWNLCYCGNITKEKGFDTVCAIVKKIAEELPDNQFNFNIIGGADQKIDINNTQNMSVNTYCFMPFELFCKAIALNHVFFDLRVIDKENDKCLPIKLFYYMACGKPVIFSNLKAIRKDVPEYNEVGAFLSNNVVDEAVIFLKKIIEDKTLYEQMSKRALQISTEKYNWKAIESRFLDFIINK